MRIRTVAFLLAILIFCISFPDLSSAADPVQIESINLDQKEVTIQIGKSLKLKADIQPGNASAKKTEWISSDESIATVKNGSVKAIAAGECSITCKATDGSSAEASCIIKVIIPVKNLKFEEKEINVPVENSRALNVIISPEDASIRTLDWISSDDSVCTVSSDGTVTGISEGKCTITCSSTDGSNKKAKITVNSVVPAPPILFRDIPWGCGVNEAIKAGKLELTEQESKELLTPPGMYINELSAISRSLGAFEKDSEFPTGMIGQMLSFAPEYEGFQPTYTEVIFAYNVKDNRVILHADDCRFIAGTYVFAQDLYPADYSTYEEKYYPDVLKYFTDHFTKLYGKPTSVQTSPEVSQTTGLKTYNMWTDDYGNKVIISAYRDASCVKICFLAADADKYLTEVRDAGLQPQNADIYSDENLRLSWDEYPELAY